MPVVRTKEPSSWAGWVYFAGSLLFVIGGVQIIAGLVALFHKDFYAVTAQGLVAFSYTTWGWASLLIGLLLLAAGVGIWAGAVWARVLGVIMAVSAMLDSIAFSSAYPLWSIIGVVLCGFVIYALTMHGSEVREY
jgi:hypothetical protein